VILEDVIDVMGLSKREFVALLGGGHSLGQMHPDRSGFTGQWCEALSLLLLLAA
jgi:catalase (peroxidase I)